MSTIYEVKVPDMGGAKAAEVIEVLVSPGAEIAKDDSVITLETEKASMEVPSPYAGIVKEVKIKVGDKVQEGHVILTVEGAETSAEKPKKTAEPAPAAKASTPTKESAPTPKESAPTPKESAPAPKEPATASPQNLAHAGPAVRQFAFELGVDLNKVSGSGHKGRIIREDVEQYVKSIMQRGTSGFAMPEAPVIDFTKFGAVETESLSKIKRFTGQNTHRSWITVPHVTQFDEADITALEKFRLSNKDKAEKEGYKLTLLVFIMKAVVAALRKFPHFNASLDSSGEHLILKKYFNVGVAVDTPNGLVVPVIRAVDQKGLFELAQELHHISHKARDKGLTPQEMQGSCFTISSLGGIGGTAFTPIINTPDVAILGVSKASLKPLYQNGTFVPRLMLPLSLSYDHRVIDGAQGARFTNFLAESLGDIRKLLL